MNTPQVPVCERYVGVDLLTGVTHHWVRHRIETWTPCTMVYLHLHMFGAVGRPVTCLICLASVLADGKHCRGEPCAACNL